MVSTTVLNAYGSPSFSCLVANNKWVFTNRTFSFDFHLDTSFHWVLTEDILIRRCPKCTHAAHSQMFWSKTFRWLRDRIILSWNAGLWSQLKKNSSMITCSSGLRRIQIALFVDKRFLRSSLTSPLQIRAPSSLLSTLLLFLLPATSPTMMVIPKLVHELQKLMFSKPFPCGNLYSQWLHCIVAGLITTTNRKLDREKQEEHILEVSAFTCSVWTNGAKGTTLPIRFRVFAFQFCGLCQQLILAMRSVSLMVALVQKEGGESKHDYSFFFLETSTTLKNEQKRKFFVPKYIVQRCVEESGDCELGLMSYQCYVWDGWLQQHTSLLEAFPCRLPTSRIPLAQSNIFSTATSLFLLDTSASWFADHTLSTDLQGQAVVTDVL